MGEYKYVTYEPIDDGRIVRIMLNRPDARNAQHRGMLVDLHEAFMEAEADDEVRVVILGGTGQMFSSGRGTTSSRTPGAGGTCARSPSGRPTATCTPPA